MARTARKSRLPAACLVAALLPACAAGQGISLQRTAGFWVGNTLPVPSRQIYYEGDVKLSFGGGLSLEAGLEGLPSDPSNTTKFRFAASRAWQLQNSRSFGLVYHIDYLDRTGYDKQYVSAWLGYPVSKSDYGWTGINIDWASGDWDINTGATFALAHQFKTSLKLSVGPQAVYGYAGLSRPVTKALDANIRIDFKRGEALLVKTGFTTRF